LFRRHRCSHRQRNLITQYYKPSNLLSEYDSSFQGYKNTKRASPILPPARIPDIRTKMAMETTTGSNYVAHPVSYTHVKPSVYYKTPEDKMDTTSVYKKEFQGKWGERASTCKPSVKVSGNKDAMELVTTHSRDYNRKDLTPTKQIKADSQYQPPGEHFNSISTAREDFIDYGRVKTHNFKPKEVWVKSKDPFLNTSSYRATFTPFQLPKRLIRSSPQYTSPKVAFEASSTSKSDYTEKPMNPRASYSIQPNNKIFDGNTPFQSTTTNRQSYQRWATPVRENRVTEKYVPPDGKLSSETTTKKDFHHYDDYSPRQSFKPTHKTYDHGKFDGTTTKAEDYKAWSDAKRPEPITHAKKYESPTSKFDSISTFQAHYLGTTQPKVPSYKPPVSAATNDAKFDSRTSYRLNYTAHDIKPCPASQITDNNLSYKSSHQYLQPAVATS